MPSTHGPARRLFTGPLGRLILEQLSLRPAEPRLKDCDRVADDRRDQR